MTRRRAPGDDVMHRNHRPIIARRKSHLRDCMYFACARARRITSHVHLQRVARRLDSLAQRSFYSHADIYIYIRTCFLARNARGNRRLFYLSRSNETNALVDAGGSRIRARFYPRAADAKERRKRKRKKRREQIGYVGLGYRIAMYRARNNESWTNRYPNAATTT